MLIFARVRYSRIDVFICDFSQFWKKEPKKAVSQWTLNTYYVLNNHTNIASKVSNVVLWTRLWYSVRCCLKTICFQGILCYKKSGYFCTLNHFGFKILMLSVSDDKKRKIFAFISADAVWWWTLSSETITPKAINFYPIHL